MTSRTSARSAASEVGRLLASDAARTRSALRNTFGSRLRTARLRAARQLATAVGAAAGLAWAMGWLASSAEPGDLTSAALGVRPLVASAFLLFLFAVDGFGRGAWIQTRWQGRFVREWLPASGVPPGAIAVRHTVGLILRVLVFSWVPLLPVLPDLQGFSVGRRLALVLAAPAFGLVGDALGVVSRRGPRTMTAIIATGGVLYWISLFPSLFTGREWLAAPLLPARTLLLSRWNVLATVLAFALAAVVNSLVSWWGSERARARPGGARAVRVEPVSRERELRVTPEAVAHARVAMRRLRTWLSRQWIAALVVGAYALMPIVILTARYSEGQGALTASNALLPVAMGLALPALVCSEVLWGDLPRDLWALFRINARSLYVPVVVPGLIALGALSIWVAIGAAALLLATPSGVRSAGPFLGVGLLLAAHVACLQVYAGALALSLGAGSTAIGRVTRYAGTAGGVLVPSLIAYASGFPMAAGWVGLTLVAAPMAAVARFARCQFGHELRMD